MLAGSLEYDGLGALQLATEVTKSRLRQFQSMIRDHQLSACRLQRGDGDGKLGTAVVRLVYSGQHTEHLRASPARAA